MVSGNGASEPVRPMAETEKDFERAIASALAPLDRMMPARQRAEALSRARREILAAAEAIAAAERKRVAQAMTPAALRKQILDLVASHQELLDYIDDIGRVPVIAAEMRRLRCRGEIGWML
jgi:acyl-CoA reductase-like NAD-dependent aldehyde dehydrogenase